MAAASTVADYPAMQAALAQPPLFAGTMAAGPSLYHPAAETLAGMTSFADVARHLGLPDDATAALVEQLGGEPSTPMQELASLSQEEWAEEFKTWTVATVKVKALTRSKAGMLGRYARLLAGLEVSDAMKLMPQIPPELASAAPRTGTATETEGMKDIEPAPTAPATAAAMEPEASTTTGTSSATSPASSSLMLPPPAPGTPTINPPAGGLLGAAGPGTSQQQQGAIDKTSIQMHPLAVSVPTGATLSVRKVELRTVIDQDLSAEVDILDNITVADMWTRWRIYNKGDPRPDVEPAADQLTGLLVIVRAGAPPYADFAVFGNADYREIIRPKLEGMRPQGMARGLRYASLALPTPSNGVNATWFIKPRAL